MATVPQFIQQNGLNLNGSGAVPVKGFIIESVNGAVAAAGTTQAAATALSAQLSIVLSATAGSATGVNLPVAVPGMGATVVNATPVTIAVYPALLDTSGTINGASYVLLPPGDIVDFECSAAKTWFGESGVGVSGSIPLELATGTVAATGTTQATAAALSYQLSRISSATAGSAQGVALPQSVGGMRFAVVNNTAVPITVYGVNAGTDTINGIAGATGVAQPPYSFVEYISPVTGVWYALNLGTGFSTSSSIPTGSATDAVTAAGTTNATAYQIKTALTRVTTNAGTPAGVTLPPTFPGYQGVAVMNASASPLLIYGAGSDQINHTGTTAATYSLAAGSVAQFFCTVAGVWHVSVSA
jgi:hypothetical protein